MRSEEQYADQKFCVAADSMATSAKGIRERIHGAFLNFLSIRADQFEDEDLRKRFEDIYEALTKAEAEGGEGDVRATLSQATDAECERIAKMIVEFHKIVHNRFVVWNYEFDKKFGSGATPA
jgi:hypothetical protein